MRDAHRSRLYADRKAAYAEFYSSYLEYRRAHDDATIAWGHRHIVARESRTRPPEDFNHADQLWDKAFERSSKARASLKPALMLVELVASPPVRDAAAELQDLAFEAGKRSLKYATTDMDDPQSLDLWDGLQQAEKAVQNGEQRLREAIQFELELDR